MCYTIQTALPMSIPIYRYTHIPIYLYSYIPISTYIYLYLPMYPYLYTYIDTSISTTPQLYCCCCCCCCCSVPVSLCPSASAPLLLLLLSAITRRSSSAGSWRDKLVVSPLQALPIPHPTQSPRCCMCVCERWGRGTARVCVCA
jgi:hypothetical protein